MGAAGPYWVTAHPVSWPPYEWPVEDVAVLVHGPPQVLSLTVERDEDFIQIPGVAQPTSAAPQLSCVVKTERLTPVADGFVRHCDASLGEQIFQWRITKAQAESRKLRLNRW